MTANEILSKVDHTLLKAFATREDIDKICEDALKYHTASVCIPPSYVKYAHEKWPELNVCTVIGFPLGYNTTAVKVFEAAEAIREGASEIDMVINIGDMKNGDYDKVKEEVAALREATRGYILKVIIETCYLTEEEKKIMCRIVTETGADFIKTSTGFGTAGATKEDIELFKANVGENVKIKAAGGMKTLEDVKMFAEMGCDRLGTSSAMRLLKEAGEIE